MARVFQEFYCTTSGGGCGGYFTIPINTMINGVVEVVCPKCQHKHQRVIKNGEIIEEGRGNGKPTQEIIGTMSAYSPSSRFGSLLISAKQKLGLKNERDGLVVTKDDEERRKLISERWFEIHGSKS